VTIVDYVLAMNSEISLSDNHIYDNIVTMKRPAESVIFLPAELDIMSLDLDNSRNAFSRVQQVKCLNESVNHLFGYVSIVLLHQMG